MGSFDWNDPGGSRTRDLRIKSPLLYQLSYRVVNYETSHLQTTQTTRNERQRDAHSMDCARIVPAANLSKVRAPAVAPCSNANFATPSERSAADVIP